jgi:hypothetical protein
VKNITTPAFLHPALHSERGAQALQMAHQPHEVKRYQGRYTRRNKYLYFSLFFVLSPGMIEDCGIQEIAGGWVNTTNFPSAFVLARFMWVSYNR